MIPVRGYEGRKIAILGLGRSGLPAARSLRAGGAHPICWDDNPAAVEEAQKEGFKIADLNDRQVWKDHSFDALILSPGIPHLYPEPNAVVQLAWEHVVPVDNDVGLFFEEFFDRQIDYEAQMPDDELLEDSGFPKVVCITGSNGKSTTTALISHILGKAGRNVQMGGNIGRGVLDLDPPEEDMVYVLELSSYQTDLARALYPAIAVFLNLTPDHYDRHAGKGGYFAAKKRMFEPGEPAVIGVDEHEGAFLADQLVKPPLDSCPLTLISVKRPLRGALPSVFAEGSSLIEWDGNTEIARVALAGLTGLRGQHNYQNACAAWAVCRGLGLEEKEIVPALENFPGLEHRMALVGLRGKVQFVNDSKATNAESAARALDSFDDIYWIAGGLAKDGGIGSLKKFYPKIRRAYLIGEAASDFAGTLEGAVPYELCGTLETAITRAAAEAGESDAREPVVLLAPACASFDQYPSFARRGEEFTRLVAELDGMTMREETLL